MPILEGLDKVINGLNNIAQIQRNKTMAGMLAAGNMILQRSQRRVPVHKGKLRASGYCRKEEETFSVVVGYSAKYARAVHENVEMKLKGQKRRGKGATGTYWTPGEAKFLEKPFREGRADIIRVVRSYSLIGR